MDMGMDLTLNFGSLDAAHGIQTCHTSSIQFANPRQWDGQSTLFGLIPMVRKRFYQLSIPRTEAWEQMPIQDVNDRGILPEAALENSP